MGDGATPRITSLLVFLMLGFFYRISLLFFVSQFTGLLIYQGSGAAEEAQAPIPLTLREAVKTGLEKNPVITAAESQVEASEARISQARSGFYPRVDLSESFTRTNNPMWAFGTKLNQGVISAPDFDPSRLNDPDSVNNFATTLSLTMPVYDRGQTRIGLNQAKLDQRALSLSAERVRQEVIMNVVASYVGVLLARENLGVVEQTLETARAQYHMVRSRYHSGLVVKSDLLRAEIRIAELEQERSQIRSLVDVTMASLGAAMGMETHLSYQLTTRLERGPDLEVPMETWIEKSIKNRPDLQQSRFREIMAEEEVKKARAAHLPGIYLSGNYEIDSEDWTDTANNYSVGAVMRFNLFSGFGLESKVREAVANLRQIKAMVRQQELAIEVETRRAYLQAESSLRRIEVAQAAVAQAEEGLRIVRNRYESGLITIVDLLDAEATLQRARTNYLRSLHDYKLATTQLQLAAGIIDGTSH